MQDEDLLRIKRQQAIARAQRDPEREEEISDESEDEREKKHHREKDWKEKDVQDESAKRDGKGERKIDGVSSFAVAGSDEVRKSDTTMSWASDESSEVHPYVVAYTLTHARCFEFGTARS